MAPAGLLREQLRGPPQPRAPATARHAGGRLTCAAAGAVTLVFILCKNLNKALSWRLLGACLVGLDAGWGGVCAVF